MGRIRLHQTEYDRCWLRILMLGTLTAIFGLFSSAVLRLIVAEAPGLANLRRLPINEMNAADLPTYLPVAVAMLAIPALTALTIGVHTLRYGGSLGFLSSLFSIPLGGNFAAPNLSGNPVLWSTFLAGALLAFYLGDTGSWLCRRRLAREAREEMWDAWAAAQEEQPR